MPKVSVILDNYNYAEYIGQAIDSVLAQSYTGFELIVVDDGSTDNSREVIDGYGDSRITRVYKENGGQTSAFNAGFEAASGSVVAFLDSDDYWYPDKLARIVAAHEGGAEIVQHYLAENGGAAYREIDESADRSAALNEFGYMYQHSPTSALSFSRGTIAPFFPLADAGDMRGYADGCVLMLAMTRAKVVCLSDVLGYYRVHGKNLNANNTDSGQKLKDVSVRQREYVNKQLRLRGLPELHNDDGQYIEHLLSQTRFDGKPVVVFGAGNSGKAMAKALNRLAVPIWGFATSRGEAGTVNPAELAARQNEFGQILAASSAQRAISRLLADSGLGARVVTFQL